MSSKLGVWSGGLWMERSTPSTIANEPAVILAQDSRTVHA